MFTLLILCSSSVGAGCACGPTLLNSVCYKVKGLKSQIVRKAVQLQQAELPTACTQLMSFCCAVPMPVDVSRLVPSWFFMVCFPFPSFRVVTSATEQHLAGPIIVPQRMTYDAAVATDWVHT